MQELQTSAENRQIISQVYQQSPKNIDIVADPIQFTVMQKDAVDKIKPCRSCLRSLSPIIKPRKTTKKPVGILEARLYKKIDQYKQHKDQKAQQKICKMTNYSNQTNIRSKPTINQKSIKLYEKRKNERSLSPNVFQRLVTYQDQQSKIKVLKTIQGIKLHSPSKTIKTNTISPLLTPKQIKYLKNTFHTQNEENLF